MNEDTPKDINGGGMDSMNYGTALSCLKNGMLVQREGWNGKGMFIFLVQGSSFKVNRAPLLGIFPEGHQIDYCPHIDMYTADKKVVPWLCSQTDAMAIDWKMVAHRDNA